MATRVLSTILIVQVQRIHWIPCHRLSCFLAASGIYYLVVVYTKLREIALVEDAKECPSSKPLAI
jgi:hypothetical protein